MSNPTEAEMKEWRQKSQLFDMLCLHAIGLKLIVWCDRQYPAYQQLRGVLARAAEDEKRWEEEHVDVRVPPWLSQENLDNLKILTEVT